jgi:pyridoxamine 5'-phosphate oxidase-like protein
MPRWEVFETQAPELAAFVRERIHLRQCYVGTLRRDGGPRVNPVTPWFAAGRLFIRMYPGSVKVRSLERDPRYSLHSSVPDDEGTGGEALLFGTAAVVEDRSLLAEANAGRSSPERYVVLEFGVDRAMTTAYEGDDTVRRRWPA